MSTGLERSLMREDEESARFDRALVSMNEALAAVHAGEYRALGERLPTIFVVGAPRSGTTLALQLISSCLGVAYVNNLIAAFWRAPLYGVRLSQRLLPRGYASSFESAFGRTLGAQEPHEFGRFWNELLSPYGLREPRSFDDARVDWARFERVLNNVVDAFDAPTVFKAPMLGWYIPQVQRLLRRSIFVRVLRDPLDNALSLLRYRKALRGDEKAWVSLRPHTYTTLLGEPAARQVAGQLFHLERAMSKAAVAADPARLIELSYAQLCAEPRALLEELRAKVSVLGGVVEEGRQAPRSFERRRARRDDHPAYDAVAAAVRSFFGDAPGDGAPRPTRAAGDVVATAPGRARSRAQVLAPQDPRWSAALRALQHDVYHLPAYAQADAARQGGEGIAILVEEGARRLLMPLVLTPVDAALAGDEQLRDAISPYGYASPVASEGAEASGFLSDALASAAATLAELGIVSAFSRLHPFLNQGQEAYRELGQLRHRGETVWIDLSLSEAERWRQTNATSRRLINRLRRRVDYTVREDERWERLDDFILLYEQTMTRVGASAESYFPRAYYEALRDQLGGAYHLVVAERGGALQSAGLFSAVGGIVQYHLGGTADGAVNESPFRLVLDFVARWASTRGYLILHLGGGVGSEDDALLRFKRSFSKLRAHFRTWELVLLPDQYERLTARRRVLCGGAATAFFPAYRAPAPRHEGSAQG